MQCKLGVTPTRVVDDTTRGALRAWLISKGKPVTTALDPLTAKAILYG